MALPTLPSSAAQAPYSGDDSRNYITSLYGTNVSNAVAYNQASVTVTTTVNSTKWSSIQTQINQERARRGYAAANFNVISPIGADQFNAMITGLNVPGPAASQAYNTSKSDAITTYPQTPAPTLPSAVTAEVSLITASSVNALITALNAAGAACTCNCNYCTCNCNYCTCNCNYSCTCNCNYSDRRLKMNIDFIGIKNGLKMYSFNYIWNKTKLIGVMAQDLLHTKYESALSKDKNGFYMVDYSQLPI